MVEEEGGSEGWWEGGRVSPAGYREGFGFH